MLIVVDVVVECELSPKDLLSVNCLSDVKYFLLTSDFTLFVFVYAGFLANKCANALSKYARVTCRRLFAGYRFS